MPQSAGSETDFREALRPGDAGACASKQRMRVPPLPPPSPGTMTRVIFFFKKHQVVLKCAEWYCAKKADLISVPMGERSVPSFRPILMTLPCMARGVEAAAALGHVASVALRQSSPAKARDDSRELTRLQNGFRFGIPKLSLDHVGEHVSLGRLCVQNGFREQDPFSLCHWDLDSCLRWISRPEILELEVGVVGVPRWS